VRDAHELGVLESSSVDSFEAGLTVPQRKYGLKMVRRTVKDNLGVWGTSIW
jgi:hypothetical protein